MVRLNFFDRENANGRDIFSHIFGNGSGNGCDKFLTVWNCFALVLHGRGFTLGGVCGGFRATQAHELTDNDNANKTDEDCADAEQTNECGIIHVVHLLMPTGMTCNFLHTSQSVLEETIACESAIIFTDWKKINPYKYISLFLK